MLPSYVQVDMLANWLTKAAEDLSPHPPLNTTPEAAGAAGEVNTQAHLEKHPKLKKI